MSRWFMAVLAALTVAGARAVPPVAPGPANGSAYDKCQTNFTVVVLGSSTAAGAGATPMSMAWAYRYKYYLQHISPTNQVINRAQGGYTTYNVLPTGTVPPAKRPAPDPLRNITYAISLKPSVIILSLPTNDAANGYTLAETTANFTAIASAARAAKIPMWVTTPQPRNLTVDQRAKLVQLRAFINATFGVNTLDFYSGLGAADGTLLPMYDSGDGTHPNNVGHAVLFRRVVAANIPEIVCASALGLYSSKSVQRHKRLTSIKPAQPVARTHARLSGATAPSRTTLH